MKTLFMLIASFFQYIEKWAANKFRKSRTKRAIWIANDKKKITGKNHYVILVNDTPLVVNKAEILVLKRIGMIDKNKGIDILLNEAVYKTSNNLHLE